MADALRRNEIARIISRLRIDTSQIWARNVQMGKCPLCGMYPNLLDFRDEISKREFASSHVCQECQDDVFGARN